MKNSIIFLLVCFTVLACNNVYDKVAGKWKISKTGLLLTSLEEEKEDMYTTCIGRNVRIYDALISFDQPDVCFDCEKGIKLKQHYRSKWKDLKVNNVTRLLTNMGFNVDGVLLNKTVEVFEGEPVKKNTMDEKVLVLVLDESEIIIYEDPYFLLLKQDEVINTK